MRMQSDLPINHFKQALADKKVQIGLWLMSCAPSVCEAVASAGFDWLVIDMEHSPNDVGDVMHQLRSLVGGTAEPIIRLPWNDPVLVKRLLDCGVRSFLFPFIQSADEARLVVAATRYPPKGIRGVAGTTRANLYGRVPDYFRRAESQICVLAQIETRKAAALSHEIAAVEGIDGLFVGPADLSTDFGFPNDWDRPEVWPTILDVGAQARAQGKAAGFLSAREQDCRKVLADGFSFVATGSDLGLIARGADALVKLYKS